MSIFAAMSVFAAKAQSPAPIVVHEARSQSSPPRTKSSIVSPRITLKPMDASPLRMSSMAEATVSERCFDVLVNRTAP